MEWDEYKRICERADCFSRWAIEMTLAHQERDAVESALMQVLEGSPVSKPVDHTGGRDTDCFYVNVPLDHAHGIVSSLQANMTRAEGKTFRHLRHLTVVWQEYIDAMK